MIVDMVNLKLSAQRALLGNVFPNLRAVCVNATENLIYVCFYYDGEISENDKDLCECVLDDIISDFSHFVTEDENSLEFETPFIRIDFPTKMPLIGDWVYYRKE